MERVKRWEEIDVTQIGLILVQALNNLERGEDAEFDVDLGGRSLRLVNDATNRRVVIFELSNVMEQRKWQWSESGAPRPSHSLESLEDTDEGLLR